MLKKILKWVIGIIIVALIIYVVFAFIVPNAVQIFFTLKVIAMIIIALAFIIYIGTLIFVSRCDK